MDPAGLFPTRPAIHGADLNWRRRCDDLLPVPRRRERAARPGTGVPLAWRANRRGVPGSAGGTAPHAAQGPRGFMIAVTFVRYPYKSYRDHETGLADGGHDPQRTSRISQQGPQCRKQARNAGPLRHSRVQRWTAPLRRGSCIEIDANLNCAIPGAQDSRRADLVGEGQPSAVSVARPASAQVAPRRRWRPGALKRPHHCLACPHQRLLLLRRQLGRPRLPEGLARHYCRLGGSPVTWRAGLTVSRSSGRRPGVSC